MRGSRADARHPGPRSTLPGVREAERSLEGRAPRFDLPPSARSTARGPRCTSESAERRGFPDRLAAAYGSGAMGIDVVSVADRALGNAIERMTNAHHARRLGRLGRGAQRTPPDD